MGLIAHILYAGWLCGVGWVLYVSIRDLVRRRAL